MNYYHFDKPGMIKGNIDLTSQQIHSVSFIYAGAQSRASSALKQARPAPHVDDEFRITLANRENFIFRASKINPQQGHVNASIEQWEREIRRFTTKVRLGIWSSSQVSVQNRDPLLTI